MLYKNIAKVIGYYFFGLTLTLFIPLCIAFYYQYIADPQDHPQPHTTVHFFWTIVVSLGFASLCYFFGRHSSGHLYRREGFITAVLIWFATPAIAALPFYFSHTLDNPFQAYFEATSGFSTTGTTAMQAKKYDPETGKEIPIQMMVKGIHTVVYSFYGTIDPVRDLETGKILYEGVEAVSKALLFWRSFTQWLGGMGIIVLFVAVLPMLGAGGKMLYRTETPGPSKESLTPRIKETAIHLWKIYVVISLVQVIFLMLTNAKMTWFDAFTITFSTISTGGFTVHNSSIGYYNNAATEWVVIFFMIIGAINFSYYFNVFKGKFYRIYEPNFFLFLVLLLGCCCVSSWFLISTPFIPVTGEAGEYFTLGTAIRYGFFQITTAMTTTGFVTCDYETWPYPVQTIMLLVMFIGGMAGSTTGGMKVIRLLMLFRIAQYKVESLFQPQIVRRFKIGKKEVDSSTVTLVLVFFLIFTTFSVFAVLLFVIDGVDPESSISIVALLINTVGTGFRMASPSGSMAFLSNFGCLFSSFLMVLGRLEFLTVLTVLVPAFWRQTK